MLAGVRTDLGRIAQRLARNSPHFMDCLCRQLLLPASEIFLGCSRRAKPQRAVATKDDADRTTTEIVDDWKLFLSYCEILLKAGGLEPCPVTLGRVAVQIAWLSNNCYCAGFNAGAQQVTSLRAERARVAKRCKADERGRIVRRAIIAVCAQQKLTPVASEKFAASIQAPVVEAAQQFGLADVKRGTSPRSLQRHIAAILKDTRIP